MFKRLLFPGLLLFGILALSAPAIQRSNDSTIVAGKTGANGIQFIEGDWQKALAMAKSGNKLVFLDAYTSWCGPCKMLKRRTFPDKAAGDFFNTNFINIAVDMEKGDGPRLAIQFAVTAYPTLIIADSSGAVITYSRGFMSPEELLKFGNYALQLKQR